MCRMHAGTVLETAASHCPLTGLKYRLYTIKSLDDLITTSLVIYETNGK